MGTLVSPFSLLQSHLEGLDEGPQESPDSLTPAQQFDQSHHPEQAEEGDGDASAVLCVLKRMRARVIMGQRNKRNIFHFPAH